MNKIYFMQKELSVKGSFLNVKIKNVEKNLK
nr:MAG TPA: KID repeat [Caudoviricetes sp.]